jgi:hypothetical protein
VDHETVGSGFEPRAAHKSAGQHDFVIACTVAANSRSGLTLL